MKEKVIIGIVSRPIHSETNRNMLGVYETYIRAVIKNGGIPFIISPTQNIIYEEYNNQVSLNEKEIDDLKTILEFCDGIIMPGGDKAFCYDYEIVKYAIEKDIPILGICLGMQIMCTLDNAKLYPVSNHYLTNHSVTLIRNSKLYEIFNKEIILVNSRHKEQAKTSGIYNVIGISPDGVIEAVEYNKNLFNIGVEWHPEDMKEHTIIFKKLMDACKNKKAKDKLTK